MAGGIEDLGSLVESVADGTTEFQEAQETVDAVASTSMESANVSNASNEGGIDSAVLDQAISQIPQNEQKPEEVQKPEDQQLQEPPKEKRITPSQKRIMELVNQRNQERQRAAQLESRLQAFQAQIAQQQAQFQAQQLAIEQRRLQMEEERSRAFEESGLSDVDKAKRQFLAESRKEAEKALSPELVNLKNELAAERQWRQQLTAAAEQRARFAKIDAMGQRVLNDQLLKGYSAEDAKVLKEPMEEMLHAFSGAYRAYPNQVAPKFQEFMDKWYAAESRRRAATTGARLAQSRQAPAVIPPSRGGSAAVGAMPSLDQLRRNGIENHIQWVAKGRPQLAKP